jgi:hypothetical protein
MSFSSYQEARAIYRAAYLLFTSQHEVDEVEEARQYLIGGNSLDTNDEVS